MSWREIVVYAKRDSGQEPYVQIAAQLAQRFGARVTGVFPLLGKRVLVAWDGSREAARALTSAMPMIDRAESVVLLAGMSKEQFSTVTRRPEMHVRRRLQAHCANVAVVEFQTRGGGEGAGILESAEKHGCDVIVMGAYGHSRVRELILGGATRDVLREMSRPVLFAH